MNKYLCSLVSIQKNFTLLAQSVKIQIFPEENYNPRRDFAFAIAASVRTDPLSMRATSITL